MAEALEYANRQGVLHRDVKPSNLLLDNRGNVWVADFGLAKTAEADDLTHTGDILGTIRYMAPERFAGKCDARSDVYSLGLTLYELVALRPAFEAADRHALIERVLHEEPERLRKLAPARAAGPGDDHRQGDAPATRRAGTRRPRPWPRTCSGSWRTGRSGRGGCRRRSGWCGGAGGTRCWRRRSAWRRRRWWPWPSLSLLYAGGRAGSARSSRRRTPSRRRQAAADGEYKAALAESNRRLAMLDLERGRAAFEKGQLGVGMLWTVESLRMATEAGDPAWTARRPGQPVGLAAPARRAEAVFSHGGLVGGRLQPRRQDGPHREHGRDGAAVGCRHRPAHRRAPGASGRGV